MATPPSPNHAFSTSPTMVKTPPKLPVKRKTEPQPQTSFSPTPLRVLKPFNDDEEEEEDDDDLLSSPDHGRSAAASNKYNRLWSEPDEIRFLRALLQSCADGYLFPRDMPHFFDRFKGSMSRSYTRTQFSEKLRRLRKKFRAVSARIRKGGTAVALKTPHEKVVYELSLRLWGTEATNGPPAVADGVSAGSPPETIVIIPHEPAPAPAPATPPPNLNVDHSTQGCNPGGSKEEGVRSQGNEGIRWIAAETVACALDQSIKDVRMVLVGRAERAGGTAGRGRKRNMPKEWGRQQIAEFDVLSQRLKLVLEMAIANLREPVGLDVPWPMKGAVAEVAGEIGGPPLLISGRLAKIGRGLAGGFRQKRSSTGSH
ncbi:Mediator-associated protein 1 [Nymphaea thermarum]|nr:Mediator-associated protein 1 [Nymphaea thermarum]